MIMERQGFFGGFQISGYLFVWVVLAVLFISIPSFAVCDWTNYPSNSSPVRLYGLKYASTSGCSGETCGSSTTCESQIGNWTPGGRPYVVTMQKYGEGCVYIQSSSECGECATGTYRTCRQEYFYCKVLACNDGREADSLDCITSGDTWSSEGYCLDNSKCNKDRDDCEAAGGTFSGGVISVNGQACCSAECNLCSKSSLERRMAQKIALCCSQGMAPPGKERMCTTPVGHAGFKCGMAVSTVSDDAYDWRCRDPGLDEENFQSYIENCEGDSSDSQNSSSSIGGSSEGIGSSSGGTGESSSGTGPYPEGCDECPWLDSILDTLIAIKGKVEGIEECVTDPILCANIEPTTGDSFEYGYLDSILVLLDSALIDNKDKKRYLAMMDTALHNMLKHDSAVRKLDSALTVAGLKNDTNIRRTLADGNYNVDTNFKSLRNAIYNLDTATIHHLDSIVKHLPDSILDSIRKYQDSALDRFDSALWGKGVGFSLIDSMVDSVVKYFQVSNHYDSMYAVMFGESMDRLMSKMDEMSFGIDGNLSFQVELDYGPLGYGDTATVTLRDDMNRMREEITNVIMDLDSSVGNDLRALVEEQKSFYIFSTGYGATSGSSTLKDDIADVKGMLGSILDSANRYFYSGSGVDVDGIKGAWGDSVAKYDVGANYDSIEAAWGADKIEGRFDSSYAYGMCNGDDCPPCSDDSCMGRIDPSRMLRAGDSMISASGLGDILEQSVSQQRDSLPTYWDSVYRELREISFFKSFDSTFLAGIGAKIPNTNSCPEDCFRQNVDGTYAFVQYNLSLDWKLCAPVAPNYLNRLNAFDLIKLLARILTVVTCLSIIMWEVSSRRGGIGL